MFSVKPGAGWSFKGENYEPPASVRFHLIIPLLFGCLEKNSILWFRSLVSKVKNPERSYHLPPSFDWNTRNHVGYLINIPYFKGSSK